MFSRFLYTRLSNSTQIAHLPNFFRTFENYLQVNCFSTSLVVKNKKSVKKLDEDKSFTVSYLMNSHGFSRERAVSISAKIHFNDSQKPNSVLALLKSYGFTDTQIASVVRKTPTILITKKETILPKIEFFLSVGMSKPFLATFFAMDPTWFSRSLENLIIPNHNFLKSILLTDERVIAAMKRNSWVFRENAEKRVGPNIEVLKELKVPESCICLLLLHFSETLILKTAEFKGSVSKVLGLEFDPLKTTFVLAIHAVSGKSNQATWDQCYKTYTSWGWSKEDIYVAFRKHPNCMIMSQNKISRAMDFFVNTVGMNAKVIAQTPSIMYFSLEKRIKPRFAVIQVLVSKGLIKHYNLNSVLSPAEKYFLYKFVVPFENKVPELYDIYRRKIGDVDL